MRTYCEGSPLSSFGSSRQRTATASAVASLFDGGRGQYLRTWFVRMSLLGARSEYPDCPRFLGGKFAVLFIELLLRRFCALTERLCL